MSLDKKDIEKIAGLAHIAMTDEQLERITPDMNGIIGWVEELGEVDTDNVEPQANVMDQAARLRKDGVNDGQIADKVLHNAPESTQGFFVVPKIVEGKDE